MIALKEWACLGGDVFRGAKGGHITQHDLKTGMITASRYGGEIELRPLGSQ